MRIAVNADSLDTWFLSALAQVEGLLFDLVVDDQDHSADWLRKGEVSAAVTAHADPVQGCDCVPLGRLRYLPVAAAGFRRALVRGRSRRRAPVARAGDRFTAKDRLQADWARAVAGKAVALKAHRIPPSAAFQQAVQAGMGWGMLPEPMAEAALESGSMALARAGPCARGDALLAGQPHREPRAAPADQGGALGGMVEAAAAAPGRLSAACGARRSRSGGPRSGSSPDRAGAGAGRARIRP